MPTDLFSAADNVARLLNELEHDLDQAYERAGELVAALPRARRAERLSAVVGQPIFAHLAASLQAIGEARGQAVAAHRTLDAVRKAARIEVRSWGNENSKPPSGFADIPASHLSAVS